MSTINQTIPAGATHSFYGRGDFLRIQSGNGLDFAFFRDAVRVHDSDGIAQGSAFKFPRAFDRIDVGNPTAADVALVCFVANEGIQIDLQLGAMEISNADTDPIPVNVFGAVLAINNMTQDQKGVTVTGATYTATAAGVNVSTLANANRRAIHFHNADTAITVYLAAYAAASKAACPIALMPGESLLIGDRSAAARWTAFSDGADLSVVTQEITE